MDWLENQMVTEGGKATGCMNALKQEKNGGYADKGSQASREQKLVIELKGRGKRGGRVSAVTSGIRARQNPKQKLFFASRKLYTGYGGAKGGGKTWAVRTKAMLGAYNYPGHPDTDNAQDLSGAAVEPHRADDKAAQAELAAYNGSLHTIYFVNGSVIHFGHWSGEASELEYNGQEYDWIFLDEATQFTWRAFQFLGGLLRGVNDIPKRMYVTCNPGGVGHRWVKRLFIDREYIQNRENRRRTRTPTTMRSSPRRWRTTRRC